MNRATPRLLFGAVSLASACGVASTGDDSPTASVTQAVTLSQVTSFGSNPGNLRMFIYVPAGLADGAPLVVAMHGCTQSASVYSIQTEWGNLADRFGFAVVFPEQPSANNAASCFNWFQPADIARGQGEALSIKQMVDTMKSTRGSDPARIFVTGMSAGGFMTEVMMAVYPDVFAGGAVNSGGPYACATSLPAATACQQGNVSRTPRQWGDLVRNAFPGYPGPFPRLVAFHGSSDFTVAAADLQQSVDQWSDVFGIDRTAEVNETFRTATHKVFRDAGGRALIETYLLSGVGHALTVDPGGPGGNIDQGGATGAFSEDHDIYSSYYTALFWGLTASPQGGDTVPPAVTITSPAGGTTVSGALTIAATASDDVGVTRVEVLVDGAAAGSDTNAPYAVTIDTTALANGPHALSARAFDAASNLGTSASVIVIVDNGGGGSILETFSSNTGPDHPGWTLGGWTLTAARDATGTPGSRSITATAAAAFNAVTRTATWAGVTLGAAPRLSYARQLSLTAANIFASAGLSVIVNDGTDHVVDARSITGFRTYSEPSFTARNDLDLSPFAGKTITLKLTVTAADPASAVTSASATIDQIELR